MATPHVSAVAALYASCQPVVAPQPVGAAVALKSNAQHISGNKTQPLSSTDTSAGDLTGVACPTGYCHLGGSADLRLRSLRSRPG